MRVLAYTLVAVSILALAKMLMPMLRPVPPPVLAAKCEINSLATALVAFRQDSGIYPLSTAGLQELLHNSAGVTNWRGPYVDERGAIPNDPWGRPYAYECPGRHHSNAFDLCSAGPDGRFGTGDDITNWLSGK